MKLLQLELLLLELLLLELLLLELILLNLVKLLLQALNSWHKLVQLDVRFLLLLVSLVQPLHNPPILYTLSPDMILLRSEARRWSEELGGIDVQGSRRSRTSGCVKQFSAP